MADKLDGIVESPEAERLATGYQFTEGPVWHPDGYLLFTDIPQDLVLRLDPGGEPVVIRENSGGANGMTLDLQGRLVMCEGSNHRVTRMEPDGSISVVADRWEGKRLNAPNDVVGRSDGTLYFTDPGGGGDDPEKEVDRNVVYGVTPDGEVFAAVPDFEYPNGLAFSPDESILYVVNTRLFMSISAFDVSPDGSLANGRIFADMSRAEGEGIPDGVKVDVEGRVYCTGPGGHWVFDASGKHVGTIRLPEPPANCAWGGPDNRTLFFTARTSVYSMRMKTPGTRVPLAG